MNSKKTASADIPLQYNTCETLKLQYGKLSGGIVKEYADHIDFYLNNYRADTTTVQTDIITVTGVTATPSYSITRHTTGANGQSASVTANYDADQQTYTVTVNHLGPIDVKVNCTGEGTDRLTDVLPSAALEQPKQPEPYRGPIIIEAENMDRKSANAQLTNSGWWAKNLNNFAGMGYIETQATTNCQLKHVLKLAEAGTYNIRVRYCNTQKKGRLGFSVHGTSKTVTIDKVGLSEWKEAVATFTLRAGDNTLILTNTSGITMIIDQVTYEPEGTPAEKFKVKILDADFGKVTADVDSAAAGDTVTLTITPEDGCAIQTLNVVNSIYFTQGLTIPVEEDAKEVTFIMDDDNMTIQPVFYDASAIYNLDFTNVASGALPEGWRTTDGTSVRNYPTTNGSGPRTFTGLTGYQGKALYWRTTSAEYGRLAGYQLTLEPGTYELIYAMAAWKGTPTYQAKILSSSNTLIQASTTQTARPNINGDYAGNISSAQRLTMNFDITTAGNYIIQFAEVGSGMQEFMLAECRLRKLYDTAIIAVGDQSNDNQQTVEIYNAAGVRIPALQKGVNIIRTKDGRSKKVLVK